MGTEEGKKIPLSRARDSAGLDEIMDNGAAPPVAMNDSDGMRRRDDPDSDTRHRQPIGLLAGPRRYGSMAQAQLISLYRLIFAKDRVDTRYYAPGEVQEIYRRATFATRIMTYCVAVQIIALTLMTIAMSMMVKSLDDQLFKCQTALHYVKHLIS